ncbi:MAG: PSD1 and planctomycete cytochrome C domain-containing protein [Gemmataceae bacterium]
MRTSESMATLALLGILLPLQAAEKPAPASPSPEAISFFEKHVRPVLADKCFACHGPKLQRGSLRMDSRQALLKGGDSGPALVVGNPSASLLIKMVKHEGDVKMPPKIQDRLDATTIGHLAEWIRTGAIWPSETGKKPVVSSLEQARAEHWAYRPVARPALPAVQQADWVRTPIDRFILAKLEAKKLAPSPRADRRTLLRRLSFDLTGLPPTLAEVEAFQADASPDAYEKAVERLLASPAYGERWGRHWLDVSRYADTKGYVFQEERRYPFSYTYRDYVIDALNDDLPYDRFVIEQLAADRLDLGENKKALAAMGFLTLGRRFLNNIHDIIDDRIDVVSRGLMGLTVGCARCHDHKYDPIPSRDYYSLYGVFASSQEPGDLPLLQKADPTKSGGPFEVELKRREEALNSYLAKEQADLAAKQRARVSDYLLAAVPNGKAGEVDGRLAMRWRQYLARVAAQHHPVLTPLLTFARASEKDYAALAAKFAKNQEPGKSLNPLVARLFAGAPPKSLAEVTTRYGQLFAEVDRRWQETQKKDATATRLADADAEALRQVLYAPDAPAVVPLTDLPRLVDRAKRNQIQSLKRRVDQWKASRADAPARAMVLIDLPNPVQPRVLVRGNPGNPGVVVPRQFLEVVHPQRKPFAQGSGRLELAQAIASPDNPLTARVMANRVWMHHFGASLVRTPGDFGMRGEPPTHPELLDWLASEFVASHWSLKTLHRRIVLSAAYQQASEANPTAAAIDPDNSLLWRMNRRRLEFEPLRDALLASAGKLDRQMHGPGVEITRTPYPGRRSVYAFIERQNLPGIFRSFDLASPDVSTPQRHTTTVPQQSLFLMNSPFVQELAKSLAERPEVQQAQGPEAQVRQLYGLALGRPAEPDEVAMGAAYLSTSGAASTGLTPVEQLAQVLLLSNEFIFVD